MAGFALGCLILLFIPRKQEKEEPGWKAQRAHFLYYPLTLKDAYEREVRLERQPWRIISLAPSVTEILYSLNAGDRLVANTDWCKYPEEAINLVKVGNIDSPNREIIIQLRPTLVIGSILTSKPVYNQLEEAGIPAFALAHSNLDTVLTDIGTMGKLLGIPGKAIQIVQAIKTRRYAILKSIQERGNGTKPRTLILYNLDGLYSAGKNSWPGDIITSCEGINIADEAPSAWPALSLEGIIEADPEVIIVTASIRGKAVIEKRIEKLKANPVWQNVSATKNNRIYIIDEEILNIPGPRMIEGLEACAHFIHPEAFEL